MKKLILTFLFATIASQSFAQSISLSEINYKSDPTNDASDWVELHNYGMVSVSIAGFSLVDADPLSTPFIFPAGATIAAGGYAVLFRDNVRFSNIHPGVANKFGPMAFTFGKNGDTLTLRDATGNTLRSEMYDSSLPWPKVAEGFGRTIELRNANAPSGYNIGVNWKASCMNGSPGAASTPCNDPIIFTEINYNSDTLYNHGEFVELKNTTGATINLTGWALRDRRDTVTNVFYFPSGTTLAAGAYLVASNDLTAFSSFHAAVTNVVGPLPFSFGNGGEALRLFDAAGVLRFSVFYNDSLDWTIDADGTGKTLEILSQTGNMNEGSNWFAGCILGSPGAAYTSPCFVSIDDNFTTPVSVASSIINNELTINNMKPGDVIHVYDATGREIMNVKTDKTSNQYIDASKWNKGTYWIQVAGYKSTPVFKF